MSLARSVTNILQQLGLLNLASGPGSISSAIPFILAGGTAGGGTNQFTMGNNGALTTLPVLPTTYSGGAFIYMPAGAIFVGSAAGWYWFVASSTTAGQVFNNTYTSGDPERAVPSTPTPFVSTGPGVITQTVGSAILAHNFPIAARQIGKTGSLRSSMSYSCLNNANAKNVGMRYSGSLSSVGNIASLAGARQSLTLSNRNAFARNVLTAGGGQVNAASAVAYGTLDTAALWTPGVSMNLGVATDFIVLEQSVHEVMFGE